jgi:DNA-binding NtrC family response regulator
LEGIRNALRKEPYDIVTATSAVLALKTLTTRPIDVVVSDEQMPGLSGSKLLATVRQMYPTTVRIMLTGCASLEAAIRAINEGEVYRFLTKPCNLTELAQVLRSALLLKNLVHESTGLLATARQQRVVLEELEREHPGITRVKRSASGCIVLGDLGESAAALIQEMHLEARRARTRKD